MIKTDFEPFCENCEFIHVTSDTNISVDFADNPVMINTTITCERISSCRRAVASKKADMMKECRTCKYYVPYIEQFSYKRSGDGYCKSILTTSEGQAYINCHDEWYCANYEKEGDYE